MSQVLGARRVERIGYAIGAVLLLSGLVHVAILLISGDSLGGADVTPQSGDAFVAPLLAFGGFTLVVTITTLMCASFRTDTAVPVSLRVAIRVGFVALFGAQVIGALMIAKGMSLVFSGNPQAAYASAGWLKPTHAVMMHGILALPVIARLLSFTGWHERRRLDIVLLATLAYVIVVGVVAVDNVMSPAR